MSTLKIDPATSALVIIDLQEGIVAMNTAPNTSAEVVSRAARLAAAFRAAKAAYRQGRSVILFPEGTRKLPGAAPAYDAGVHGLYRAMGAACLPVAVHSGHVWPPGSWRIRPGTAFLHFLTPLPPGLPRDEFMARLSTMIEEYSAKS